LVVIICVGLLLLLLPVAPLFVVVSLSLTFTHQTNINIPQKRSNRHSFSFDFVVVVMLYCHGFAVCWLLLLLFFVDYHCCCCCCGLNAEEKETAETKVITFPICCFYFSSRLTPFSIYSSTCTTSTAFYDFFFKLKKDFVYSFDMLRHLLYVHFLLVEMQYDTLNANLIFSTFQ
jgi:hypothetical protein